MITVSNGAIKLTDEQVEEAIIKYLIRNRTRRQIDLLLSICDEDTDDTPKKAISRPVTDIYGDDTRDSTPRQEIKLSREKKTRRKMKVERLDIDGNVISTYPSIRAAVRDGYKYHIIRECCMGKRMQDGNHRWRFAQQRQSI